MQVSAVLSFMAAAVAAVNADDSFSAEDQAIWIDRYNFFRTTGLPWSAGDMRRIGWSSDLATTAASTAAKCSATTAAGVNVYQSSSSNSSSIIDEAIQQWVVETSMTTLKTLAQPGASGVDVGTGTYNSYSQVLWASTTSVGCASASCSGGEMVVCEYSPAGNDGSSAWYIHADTASNCPSGTTASQGLCIVEGDSANNQIAAIPAGKLTYEVYPAYVADMQTALIEAARAIADGATQTAQTAPTATTAAPTATTAAPTATTATPTATTAAPTSEMSSTSSKEDGSDTKTKSTKKTPTSSSDSSASSSSSESSSTATKTGKTTATSSSTDSSSDSSTKQSSKTTASSSDDSSAPGTVKASSDTGSTFTNQETSTTPESSTEQTSSSTTTPATPSTASTESTTPTSGSGTATSINNQSSTSSGGGISPAGLAGMIVLAIVGVAAFGVVMSYKRNQQRQREIMRDGGIRII